MVLESNIDKQIEAEIKSFKKCKNLWNLLTTDEEIYNYLEQANKVSIVRMGFNDHGRVHAKVVTMNSLKIYRILESKGILGNVVTEGTGDEEDVRIVLMMSAYLHDSGVSISRKHHDVLGLIISKDLADRLLKILYKNQVGKIARMKSAVMECVLCHLGEYDSTALESKIIATADGTDMTKGRARIPYRISKPDIHKFSAMAIDNVEVTAGKKKPIRILVGMSDTAGVFQIEGQLMQKLRDVGFADHVEIFAKMNDGREFSYW